MKIGDSRDISGTLKEMVYIIERLEEDLWLVTISRGQNAWNEKWSTEKLRKNGFKGEPEKWSLKS